MQSLDPLRSDPCSRSNAEQLHRVAVLPMPLQADAGVRRFRLEHELREVIRRHRTLLQPKRLKGLGRHAHLTHQCQEWCSSTEPPPLWRASIRFPCQSKGSAIPPQPTNLQQLIDSEPDVPTQRPHATSEQVAKTWQPRQAGNDGSAMGTQRLEHLPHPTTRADPHRLIRGLPLKLFEVGLNIHRPIVGNGRSGGGSTAAEP